METAYGLYQSDVFLTRQETILEKKKVRSELISLCMAYEKNEQKLIKVVKSYQDKIQLGKNINSINGRIRKWKSIFTGRGNARASDGG